MTTSTPPATSGAGRAVRAVIWLPGLAVALGAAVATAHGLFEVAVAARVPAGIAWLYPLITDGLALVAYAATARLTGGPARYAWTVVVLAAGLSGLAQAVYLSGGASVDATPALRFGVGAWPAVAAAVVAHLLYLLAAHPQPSTVHDAGRPIWPADSEDTAADATAPHTHGDVFDRLSAAAATTPGAVQAGVQPGVQPVLYTPSAVQPDPYNPLPDEPADPLPMTFGSGPGAVGDGPVEHPLAATEQPLNGAADPAPRDRARAAAVRHATRHGALPTVTELEALAAVSRGTAAAALRALREHPNPLHLVPDNPDPETQP